MQSMLVEKHPLNPPISEFAIINIYFWKFCSYRFNFLFHFEFHKLFSFPFRFVCPVVTTTRKTETLATTTRPATTPRHTRKQSSEKAPTGARPNTSNPSHSLSTVQKTNGATGTKDHGVSRPTGISQVITGMKKFLCLSRLSQSYLELNQLD